MDVKYLDEEAFVDLGGVIGGQVGCDEKKLGVDWKLQAASALQGG